MMTMNMKRLQMCCCCQGSMRMMRTGIKERKRHATDSIILTRRYEEFDFYDNIAFGLAA